MGTMFRIVLYAPDTADANKAARAAFDRIQTLDHIMSDYDPSSELDQLSDKAGGPPVKVSEDLFRVLSAGEDLARRSGGAFDITVGPLVLVWRRARRQHELPDPARLSQARSLAGYQNLRLNPGTRTAELLKPGMKLDLGAIAKGDAADQALIILKELGITRALVAAAGDIALGDPPPNESGWRIGIETFEAPRAEPQQYLILHNCGVSTSGDSEQHLDIGGLRYSHIIDPRTGMALQGYSRITVVAPNGITADCHATALSVLEPERGLELIAAIPGAGALIMVQNGDRVRTFASPGFSPSHRARPAGYPKHGNTA